MHEGESERGSKPLEDPGTFYEAVTEGVRVRVQPDYLEEQSSPEQGRHVWAYHVEIVNGSKVTVQLTSRHWRITDAAGHTERVDGPGVVGEQPILNPGDAFRYASGCPLQADSGFMEGTYTMVREDGSTFEAAIPAFSLDLPRARRAVN